MNPNGNCYRASSACPVGSGLVLLLVFIGLSLIAIDTVTMPVVVESVTTGEVVGCYRRTLKGDRVSLPVEEATRGRYDLVLVK